jgi:hypothetical protein
MTDLEMERLCGQAMGYVRTDITIHDDDFKCYQEMNDYYPLRDDAQAMALVKKLGLHISCHVDENGTLRWQVSDDDLVWTDAHISLNRAIVECATGSTKLSSLSTSTPEGIPESP